MSKIKNAGLDHYGAEPFEQQQFGIAGVEGFKQHIINISNNEQLEHHAIWLISPYHQVPPGYDGMAWSEI